MSNTHSGVVLHERIKNGASLLIKPIVFMCFGFAIGIAGISIALRIQSDRVALLESFSQWQRITEADAALSNIPDGISETCWKMLLQNASNARKPPSADVSRHELASSASVSSECARFMSTKD